MTLSVPSATFFRRMPEIGHQGLDQVADMGDRMKFTRKKLDTAVTALAAVILLAALPWAVSDTFEHGRLYLFSQQFLDDLPQRLSGPGRLRFILQPLMAVLIGIRGGSGDAKAGNPPYLYGFFAGGTDRKELFRSGLSAVRILIAMGIVLDAIAQILIYREVHPGAALLVGPVLICVPYAVARALSNRVFGLRQRSRSE